MHLASLSSRALLAGPGLALAFAAGAAPPPPPAAPTASAAASSDAQLITIGKGQIRGKVIASARAELGAGGVALLVAGEGRANAPTSFTLLVFGDEGDGIQLLGHDEVASLPLHGSPIVALAAGAHPLAAGAITATVGWKGPDGTGETRTVLYGHGMGRLARLLAVGPGRTFPPGSGRASVRNEIDVLPTSTRGFKDLRVRTRECNAEGDCDDPFEVASYTFDGVRYAPRPHPIPFLERIEASSELESKGGLADRSASAAVDGRPGTAWCEGAPGPGWFQKLELSFLPAQVVKAVTIVPGGVKREPFGAWTRPKRIRLLLPDGRKVEADLADEPSVQRIAVPDAERIFGLTVVIVDVYKGQRDAACINELGLEVEP